MQIIEKHDSKLTNWLTKYRLIILLVGALIIIPLITLTTFVVVNVNKYTTVTFNETNVKKFKSSYITIEDETLHQEINLETDELIVKIKIVDIVKPLFDVKEPSHQDERGSYTFKAKYQLKGSDTISNVVITLILQTDWLDAKSDPRNITLSTKYSNNQTLQFNQFLPKKAFGIINVKNPNLYIKLSYNVGLGLGESDQKEYYFKNNLKNYVTTNQIDEENKED